MWIIIIMKLPGFLNNKYLFYVLAVLAGLNVLGGKITYKPVANVLGYDYLAPEVAAASL